MYGLSNRVITGSIVRSAKRRYLSYSEADFEDFCPAGVNVAPMGVKFGTEEGTVPNFTSVDGAIRVEDPKTEIFTEI